MRGLHGPNFIEVNRKGPAPSRPTDSTPSPFTLHSADYANMTGVFQKQGLTAVMAALAIVSRAAIMSLAMTGACARAAEADLRPAATVKPLCLNAAETREEVRNHRLLEPFAALKFAAAQRKAEALSAKLCHTGDEFVYEITLLHRDGRLVHVQMEAGTGKLIPHPPHDPHEAHDTHEPHDAHDPHEAAHDQPVKN
jgi:hypothetical protein